MSLIKRVAKNKIVEEVTASILMAEREIFATMLLSEEIRDPLPKSYHELLIKRTKEGIVLKRLGFGTKEEYNQIKKRYTFKKNYNFSVCTNVKKYQRMIVVDKKTLYFGSNGVFFKSTHGPLVEVFLG